MAIVFLRITYEFSLFSNGHAGVNTLDGMSDQFVQRLHFTNVVRDDMGLASEDLHLTDDFHVRQWFHRFAGILEGREVDEREGSLPLHRATI